MSNSNPKFNKSEVLIDIKRKVKEGLKTYEITDWIKSNYEISNQSIIFLMREAKELYARELDFNWRDLMIKHSGRYEQIWKKNYTNPFSAKLDNPEDDLDDKEVRKTLFKVAKHYMIAADALRAKEKMLGLTHNRMDVELKNEFFEQEENNKEPEFDPSKYDLTKLSLQEKLELLELLKKAKGEETKQATIVTTKVTVSQTNNVDHDKYDPNVIDEFDVEDIEHEEIKDIEDPIETVNSINQKIVEGEAKKLDDTLNIKKQADKQVKLAAAKKRLLEKRKNK